MQKISEEFVESCKAIGKVLSKKPNTLVLCHKNPDGDALGALTAFGLALEMHQVPHQLACLDEMPDDFHYLQTSTDLVHDFNEKDFECVVFLDCGAHYMTGYHESKPFLFGKSKDLTSINIDHHPSNDKWSDINLVEPKMASTTHMLWHVFSVLQWEVSPDMATSLLTGIYTDTGSFMHQNTSSEVLKVASKLLNRGASINEIAKNVFQKFEYKKLKLWGKVLEGLHLNEDGAAIVGVHEDDYKAFGCERSDLAGVIDFINSIPEAEYSVVLSEDGKGNVKASLRTRKDDVNVNELAKKFGGGGHVKASGFTIPKGKLKKEIKWKIVSEEA